MKALQKIGGVEVIAVASRTDDGGKAFAENRLLFEARHGADLRGRIIADLDSVAREYELNAFQRRAAQSLINVGKGGLVSEHVPALVEAGAHPLQALMSLHAIYSMSHRATTAH
jgi:hypothetical protein